ncbi:hypothetical protein THASP1DRAFT_31524 [Thamnocephalis sphaerospora]|uniref:FHA domain-containing protein n=1 Tax=Thamnocephalis sphaerospora TaxID=78915 RepID=A0A4P9XMQ0_9FUNG|nr:hypothetical protein THASP1DRAFT_31524 [Thamnocephalis sphaerospora]|eukprot:RKP06661.1 hypothetical protein THASP1DRAFT_31524 [Thamnocephalis sphaerospora]
MSTFAAPKPRRPATAISAANDAAGSEKESTEQTASPSTPVDAATEAPVFRAPKPRIPAPAPADTADASSQSSKASEEKEQQQRETRPPVPQTQLDYAQPEWLGVPPAGFTLEVHKDGILCEETALNGRAFWVVGRVPGCDVVALHQSVSRYHAIIEFKENGLSYIYDLGSTHQTTLNKRIVPARRHIELRPGDHLRFGQSTRSYILQGPDIREAIEASVRRAAEEARQHPTDVEEANAKWGLAENITDDGAAIRAGMSVEQAAISGANTDASYRQDPKKALRAFLEHRGYEMEFQIEDELSRGAHTFTARLQLPVRDEDGMPLRAEGIAGRKRDAERAAALDAMEKLEAAGALNTQESQAEASKRRIKALLDDDDADSDDDSFYDRTERRSLHRNKQARTARNAPSDASKADTYDTLVEKKQVAQARLKELQLKLMEADLSDGDASAAAQSAAGDDVDALDAYMEGVQHTIDEKKKDAIRNDMVQVKKDIKRLSQLIEFTRPVDWTGSNVGGAGSSGRTAHPPAAAESQTTSTSQTHSSAPPPAITVPPAFAAPRRPPTQRNDLASKAQSAAGDGRTSLNDKFGY